MRLLTLIIFLGLVSFAQASWLSGKKKASDAEGNCIPELVAENARLEAEVESFRKESKRIEQQLSAKDKGSQKLGLEGLKKLGEKAKASRKAIEKFGMSFGKETACKVQVKKNGKPQVTMFKVGESVKSLDQYASAYIKMVDDYLKTQGGK